MLASSPNTHRNPPKRLIRSLKKAEAPHAPVACRWLEAWRREACRRARRLGAPAAWSRLSEPPVVAVLRQLARTGELASALARLCAEAVAAASDPRLVRSCRPASSPVQRSG